MNRRQSGIPELEQRMAALRGPSLDAADRNLPLPLLRNRIEALLDQVAARIERTRSSVACLALATGFADLVRRHWNQLKHTIGEL